MLARDGAGILPTARRTRTWPRRSRAGAGTASRSTTASARSSSGKLGDSFHDVRIHKDAEADALARSVSASAFTTGTDVYFAHGSSSPTSSEGKELIAHELAHVVQQRGAPTTGPMRVSQPGEPLEREAEQAARGIA